MTLIYILFIRLFNRAIHSIQSIQSTNPLALFNRPSSDDCAEPTSVVVVSPQDTTRIRTSFRIANMLPKYENGSGMQACFWIGNR